MHGLNSFNGRKWGRAAALMLMPIRNGGRKKPSQRARAGTEVVQFKAVWEQLLMLNKVICSAASLQDKERGC
jgi:hypothetical protein